MSNQKKKKDLGVITDLNTMINNDKSILRVLIRDKQANNSLKSFLEVTLAKVRFSYISSVKLNGLKTFKLVIKINYLANLLKIVYCMLFSKIIVLNNFF